MMYATHVVREEKGREVCRRLDYGLCRVRLPDHPDVPLWLVVVRGLGARPMMLLTNLPMRRNHKVLWWAVSTYLSRLAHRRGDPLHQAELQAAGHKGAEL